MDNKIVYPGLIRDALHNLSASEARSGLPYEQGITVGVVSALMSAGLSFMDALNYVKANMPKDAIPESLPKCWRE
jgi:hypothetical protein